MSKTFTGPSFVSMPVWATDVMSTVNQKLPEGHPARYDLANFQKRVEELEVRGFARPLMAPSWDGEQMAVSLQILWDAARAMGDEGGEALDEGLSVAQRSELDLEQRRAKRRAHANVRVSAAIHQDLKVLRLVLASLGLPEVVDGKRRSGAYSLSEAQSKAWGETIANHNAEVRAAR